MEILGIKSGPPVGKALRFLLELRLEHGPLGHDRAVQELLRWAREAGLAAEDPSGAGPPPGDGSPGGD
jgi:poly(A) polymerase